MNEYINSKYQIIKFQSNFPSFLYLMKLNVLPAGVFSCIHFYLCKGVFRTNASEPLKGLSSNSSTCFATNNPTNSNQQWICDSYFLPEFLIIDLLKRLSSNVLFLMNYRDPWWLIKWTQKSVDRKLKIGSSSGAILIIN